MQSIWKIVTGQVTGPSHMAVGVPCEDAFQIELVNDRILVAVVCDGAGSARYGQMGADIVSRTVADDLSAALVGGMPRDPGQVIEAAIVNARAAIDAQAACMPDTPSRQNFHTTLVGCISDGEVGWFFHIGDGAACAVSNGGDASPADWATAVVSKPANGEFSNETYFVTLDGWRDHLRLSPFQKPRTVVLMTDGVTPFAMSRGCLAPEVRFLAPVDEFLSVHSEVEGSLALAETLAGEKAAMVSGDDKTLVWAQKLD
jgi:hypothetical protein